MNTIDALLELFGMRMNTAGLRFSFPHFHLFSRMAIIRLHHHSHLLSLLRCFTPG